MMEFHSFSAFAEHLVKIAVEERVAEHEALEEAAKLIEKTAKERIGTEYAGWAPLAASTLEEKARAGYAVPAPLLRTGQMQASIEHTTQWPDADIGSDDEVAVWQELGTSRMPARSFLESSARDKAKQIVEIVGLSVITAMTGGEISQRSSTGTP